MKKILIVLVLFVGSLFVMGGGCEFETSTSFGLTAEDSVLAKSEGGSWQQASDSTFQRGDDIALILLNVRGFEKGDDGLNKMDIDLQVKDPEGEVIFMQKDMLGEEGHVNLENNIANSPYGSFSSTEELEPGRYTIKVRVRDEVGGGSTSKSKTFTLE